MMANTLTSIILVMLFCGSAVGSRTKLVSDKDWVLDSDEGICKLMVEIQGYACEEHMVTSLHSLTVPFLKFLSLFHLWIDSMRWVYQVTTQDGYILSMQRIPMGRSGEASSERAPVLLQHGLLMVSSFHLENRKVLK